MKNTFMEKTQMYIAKYFEGRKIRTFSLSDIFIESYQNKQPNWGPVGYFTYKRTYARPISKDQTEEFWQTCKRVVEGVYNVQKQHTRAMGLPWDDRKAQASAQEMFERMWQFKFTPPGRGLWMMGTDVIYKKGGAALNNCAFVTTENIDIDFAAPFCFLMDMSMFGVGVGSDTRGAGKVKIQAPKTTTEPYIVEDSREGWVELLRTILNSFVGKGSLPLNIDYSNVREMGSPIKGFGGVASGPEPLIELINGTMQLLSRADGKPYYISSTQIVDLHNMVGVCVVSGGVRRTAEIMFGAHDDQDFAKLKDPTELNAWSEELSELENKRKKINTDSSKSRIEDLKELINSHPLRTHRWASNNSIFANLGMDYEDVSKSIAKNGEPGAIWLENMRNYGRMVDPPSFKDYRVAGCNPCAEQSLEDHELCCLVETFPANHDSFEDFKRTLKFAYLYAKTVTLIPTHNQKTNQVMMRNRRIGCSMSGIQQSKGKLGRRNFLKWCDQGYEYIQDLDVKYSEWLCVPRSIKTTSVKPSGTVSLLCGATPGIHYAHSEYYIRNIRVQEGSPLLDAARNSGYPVEKDSYAKSSWVVSFPVKEKNFTKSKKDVSIWEQFCDASDMQKYWADNQVSATVTFAQEESKYIQSCLEIFETQLKSISLLPLTEHGYAQAPYITITKEVYEALSANITPLILDKSYHEAEDKFCDGDTCTVSFNNAD